MKNLLGVSMMWISDELVDQRSLFQFLDIFSKREQKTKKTCSSKSCLLSRYAYFD